MITTSTDIKREANKSWMKYFDQVNIMEARKSFDFDVLYKALNQAEELDAVAHDLYQQENSPANFIHANTIADSNDNMQNSDEPVMNLQGIG